MEAANADGRASYIAGASPDVLVRLSVKNCPTIITNITEDIDCAAHMQPPVVPARLGTAIELRCCHLRTRPNK